MGDGAALRRGWDELLDYAMILTILNNGMVRTGSPMICACARAAAGGKPLLKSCQAMVAGKVTPAVGLLSSP